jgi:hypothetical protein
MHTTAIHTIRSIPSQKPVRRGATAAEPAGDTDNEQGPSGCGVAMTPSSDCEQAVTYPKLPLPSAVEEVFHKFRTCEFATIAKDGTPIAWPAIPLYLPERGQFLLTTSIGLPQKALNIRRDPHVSLLFSNPTGSNLNRPPAVLVQGEAMVSEDVTTWNKDLAIYWPHLHRVQPFGKVYTANRLTRWFMDWYFMRLLIYVTPRSVRWWPEGDFAQAPKILEVTHVG